MQSVAQSVVQSSGLFLVTFGHVHCLPRILTDPQRLKILPGRSWEMRSLTADVCSSSEFLSSCLNDDSCHQVQQYEGGQRCEQPQKDPVLARSKLGQKPFLSIAVQGTAACSSINLPDEPNVWQLFHQIILEQCGKR